MEITPQMVEHANTLITALQGVSASQVDYSRAADRVIVTLKSGMDINFPPRLITGLAEASPEDLEIVTIWNEGRDLHWPKLGVDLSVLGLIIGQEDRSGMEAADFVIRLLSKEAG